MYYLIVFVQVEEMFTVAVRTEDKMFHVALYDWLISQHLTEKLLEVSTHR